MNDVVFEDAVELVFLNLPKSNPLRKTFLPGFERFWNSLSSSVPANAAATVAKYSAISYLEGLGCSQKDLSLVVAALQAAPTQPGRRKAKKPSPVFSANQTIAHAKATLNSHLKDGLFCPVCEQKAQMYHYAFHAGMAACLLYIYHAVHVKKQFKPGEFFHVEKYFKKQLVVGFHGYHSKLKYWNLLEEGLSVDPSKHKDGFWRITDLGVKFAERKITMPQYAWLYNGQVHGFDGASQTIDAVLGKKFNYSKLMAGTW